jgi:hypothetical protein
MEAKGENNYKILIESNYLYVSTRVVVVVLAVLVLVVVVLEVEEVDLVVVVVILIVVEVVVVLIVTWFSAAHLLPIANKFCAQIISPVAFLSV